MGIDEVGENELEFLGSQLLKKPQTNPLRERMGQFVADHEPADDVKTLRVKVADGKPLSEIVTEDRADRV